MLPRHISLRWLLLLVAIAAGLMWLITQAGMKNATVEVRSCELWTDEQGLVRGRFTWRFSELKDGTAAYSDFLCSVTRLDNDRVRHLEEGEKFRIRYRVSRIGPLPKSDKYGLFLTDSLGIDKDEIVGWTVFEDFVEVVIAGQGE